MIKFWFDAGHGGHDPGAIGNGIYEKNWVLMFQQKVASFLQMKYTGFSISYSRTVDKYIGLSQRADLANNAKVDYFISFHLNSGGGTGFESYIYNGKVSSKTIAYQNAIHSEITKFLKQENIRDRGKKRKNLAVLRETAMPAILFEMLFIDNNKDAALLKNTSFVNCYAEAVAHAIGESFDLKKKGVKQPVLKQKVSDWAKDAYEWAKKTGISDGSRPHDPATRQEIWVMLKRFSEQVKK